VSKGINLEKVTNYFKCEVLRKIINNPIKREIQPDGRIRFWGKADELGEKFLRVVTLEGGITIHNAFIDRGFKQ